METGGAKHQVGKTLFGIKLSEHSALILGVTAGGGKGGRMEIPEHKVQNWKVVLSTKNEEIPAL